MNLYYFQDDTESEVALQPPYSEIYETKSLLFKVTSDFLHLSPYLLIGDMKLELNLTGTGDNLYFYETKLGKHFINNVGVALIEFADESEEVFDTLGTVNVLSSKITTERLKAMLEYISKTDVKLLHCCFSKTFIDTSGEQFEYTDFHHKLLMTEKTLSFLWENRYKFKNQPCKRIKVVDTVKKYQPKDLVDERAYSWLLSNMCELEFTNSPKNTLINRYGKGLTARNIATSTVVDDKDIFENQVIFSFLINIKKFISTLEKEENYSNSKIDKKAEHIDIVPFIQSFVSEKFDIRKKLVHRVNSLVDNCLKFVSSNFTKTYIPSLRPRVTQYVSKHNHYMSLYKLMNDWWNISASSASEFESVHQLLFSIKSMDKLYELFVLLQMLEAFQSNDMKLINSKLVDFETFPSLNTNQVISKKPYEVFNYYKLTNDLIDAELFLEPIIYPYRDDLNEGELFILDKSPDNREAKKLYRAKYMRTPDYILKITNKEKLNSQIYILDAKYSKFETVLYDRMQTKSLNDKKPKYGLIDKYLHGIRVFESKNVRMVDGIFASYITGKPDKKRNVMYGISHDFGIWGQYPSAPFIDLIEFAPISQNENAESRKFISKLLGFSM